MDQLNFIFTRNGFHVDEAKDSAWAELFKENKYAALYELGFKNNLKGLTPSAFYLYQLSQKFIEVLSRSPELEVAREETIIELSDDDLDMIEELSKPEEEQVAPQPAPQPQPRLRCEQV